MDTSQATREIMWNISNAWIMYAMLIPTLIIAGYGFYRRIVLWRKGAAIDRFDSIAERLVLVIQDVLFQIRLARDIFGGVFHRLIFWGFLIFLVATTIVMLEYDFHIPLMKGHLYLYFQSLTVDIVGAAAFIGLLMAGIRRWVIKPHKLVYTVESNIMIVLIMAIIASGFAIEGLRIAATRDPWAAWSPIGRAVANILQQSADKENLTSYHQWFWWCHMLLAYGFIAWAPYTKLRHVITSVFNTYTANLKPIGSSLKNINLEEGGTLGVDQMDEFTWKDLLDLDACTECGQCTDNCPAATVGKELSPRDLILQLRALLNEGGRTAQNITNKDATSVKLSDRIPAEILWQCTTCAACVDVCPVYVEQMPKIVDMRRYLVMEEAVVPGTILDAVMSLEDRGHPFRGVRSTRLDWTNGLDVSLISQNNDPEVLFWVGSAGALLERSQHVTRAFTGLLKHAGVNFAILGREEKSTGDLARRIGNEFLFETIAKENIDILERYQIKKIVTCCPHCFNTLKNEYPRLGGNYEVYHHTEYLWQLMAAGRLTIPEPLARKVAYHDPCYLGRHNGVYDVPRMLLKSACGTHLNEMKRRRRRAFCCGGGGGMSFADDSPEKRINKERARHVLDTSADILAVACPYCMTMMEDGLKAIQGQREIIVKDVAELAWEALEACK